VPGLLLTERNAGAEQPEFHRVAAKGRTREFDFGALHQPKRHQALNLWISRVDGRDDGLLAASKRRESFAIIIHLPLVLAAPETSKLSQNRIFQVLFLTWRK
jgi:hypothetical protein